MGANLNFNAANIPPAEPGLPVWEGAVPVVIKRTEVQNTAKNDGNKFLAIHVQALDTNYRGQENVIRLNLWNSNSQAMDIAQRQLSAICHVANRLQIQDSDQLIGAQFLTIWAREEREIVDQATGARRTVESCQCKDFRFLDGRTIREAMNGMPAAGAHPGAGGPPQAPPTYQPPPPPAPPQGGFQPPAPPAPPGMPPMPPATGPQGFAPPGAPPAFAQPGQPAAPGGYQPPPPGQPQPGFQPPPGGPPAWGR